MTPVTIGSYIPITTANEYITNFITNYFATGKSPAKSFIYDAKMICDFIKSNPEIVNLKFMLAQNSTTSLTLVIAGVDGNGNYVTNGSTVLDNGNMCPPNCPSGTAGADTI